MLYRLDPQANSAKLYTEPRSGSRLLYRTVKEMRKRYPDGDFAIVGEIGGFARPPNDGDELLTDDGGQIPVSPRGSRIRPFERVGGVCRGWQKHLSCRSEQPMENFQRSKTIFREAVRT